MVARKFQNSRDIYRRLQQTLEPKNGEAYMVNRNPRNLEFLRIANKPAGYKLDNPGRQFWNKLNLTASGKYITAQMVHFEQGPIVEASTSEWAIKKQLFKTTDLSAYTNLARVFAQRCLESGFIEMKCNLKKTQGEKIGAFLDTMKASGIVLKEPSEVITSKQVNHFAGRKEKPYGSWEAY